MKVYEDDYILIYEYNNGTMTIDKNTGMMISWEGRKGAIMNGSNYRS